MEGLAVEMTILDDFDAMADGVEIGDIFHIQASIDLPGIADTSAITLQTEYSAISDSGGIFSFFFQVFQVDKRFF